MARAGVRTTEQELTARNVLAACCAASAGVHAALVPEHLREDAALGTGFAVAAGLLFAATLALTNPASAVTARARGKETRRCASPDP